MNGRARGFAASRTGALCLCALLFGSCATNPVTGESQLTLFTEAEEIEIGLQADREMLQTYGEYREDPALSAYVSQLGLALAARSERPDLPWSFRILDDETVNAFALPGGPVYVTRGLLAYLNRESELAGVLGHEIGHVAARHSIHGMSRDLALSVGLAAGLVLLEAEDVEPVASLGLGLLFLKFSRNQERQADALAVRYTPGLGFDPYGAVDALRILYRVSEASGEGGFPTWLSTHPDPERRWQRLAGDAGLAPMPDAAALDADRERYTARLNGLVVGPDPRNGVVEDRTYTHARDGFQIVFPPGWEVERDGLTVMATSATEEAAVLVLRGPEATVEEAEEALGAETGITLGRPWHEDLGGFRARLIGFVAPLDDTSIHGYVALVPMGETVLKILALSESARWSSFETPLYGSVRSLRRLAPWEASSARPARLRVVTLDQPKSLRQLAAGSSHGNVDELALLNDIDLGALDEPLAAGRRVKTVDPP